MNGKKQMLLCQVFLCEISKSDLTNVIIASTGVSKVDNTQFNVGIYLITLYFIYK